MEELKAKSKTEIIELALEILKQKQPSLVIDADDFESTAWQNSKETIVKFRRYFRFSPLNAEQNQYYDISVNLITKQVFPFDSMFNFTFYIPTEDDKKKLDFIKSKTYLPKQPEKNITITENEDHYWISNSTKNSLIKFFINKKTGFKSVFLQGTYSVPQVKPVFESTYDREEKVKLSGGDEISKKEIIDMAVALLNKRQLLLKWNFNDYEAEVLGDSKNTFVEFKRIIRYIPFSTDPEKCFSYDVTINVNTAEILPFDDFFKSEFYIETENDRKAISFIKKNFGDFSANFENTIYEGEEDYFIDIKNEYSFGKYTVNKKTGIVKTEIQASFEPAQKPVIENPDNYIEIK
ncbi:hypothetical protein [Flavobacterium hibisci]|uniref:hypothetical protein n=1 Tax=Flavobacterium hibisci TaxID=1914462 RepID=UPI001CBD042E|nr:hypothetical protein [Flavobacterium hibisci]MBZ4044180.1 hypothetical protein [Flavobacterium hibisci]